jgi:hypothetical protein
MTNDCKKRWSDTTHLKIEMRILTVIKKKYITVLMSENKHKTTNLLIQNTNVIGDSKQNTIGPLGGYDKIGVFSCVETKNDSCMCVVLTDLPSKKDLMPSRASL